MIDRATKLRSIEETQNLNKGGLMLGATLRVKSRVADLCRANSSVSTLVLDIYGWFIEAMFIEARWNPAALGQEGYVYRSEMEPGRPPSGGPCSYLRSCFQSDMALLTEGGPLLRIIYKHGPDGGRTLLRIIYKHGPPDGGRTLLRITSINMTLLTEGGPLLRIIYKHGPPSGGRRVFLRPFYKHGSPTEDTAVHHNHAVQSLVLRRGCDGRR